MDKQKRAIGGIGLKILIINEANLLAFSYTPKKIPKGIAMTEAMIIPKNTLTNVLTVFSSKRPLLTTLTKEFQTSPRLGKI